MKSAGKEIGDQALHFVVAAAGLIWIVLQPDTLPPYMVAGFWYGLLREDASHRPKEGWGWISPIEYIGEHDDEVVEIGGWGRWLDILFFTLGGTAVGIIATLIERGTQ